MNFCGAEMRFLGRFASLIFVLILLLSFEAGAESMQTRFSLETEPPGAQICIKSKGAYACSGVTPAIFNAVLVNENAGKKYYLKKLGHSTREVLLTATKPKASIKMARNEAYIDPAEQTTAVLVKLQKKVNRALERFYYGPGNAGQQRYSLSGPAKVILEDNEAVLIMGLIIDDSALLRRIGSLKRKRKKEERTKGLVHILAGEIAEKFLADLKAELKGLSEIKGFMLTIHYPSVEHSLTTRSSDIRYKSTVVTGSHTEYTNYGNVTQSQVVTHYRTVHFTRPLEETVVDSRKVIRSAVFSVPWEKDAKGSTPLSETAVILINDRRDGTFEPYEP